MDSLEPREGEACHYIFGNVLLLGLQTQWLSGWGGTERTVQRAAAVAGQSTISHPPALSLTSLQPCPSNLCRERQGQEISTSPIWGHSPQALYDNNVQLWTSLRFSSGHTQISRTILSSFCGPAPITEDAPCPR